MVALWQKQGRERCLITCLGGMKLNVSPWVGVEQCFHQKFQEGGVESRVFTRHLIKGVHLDVRYIHPNSSNLINDSKGGKRELKGGGENLNGGKIQKRRVARPPFPL